MNNCLNCGVVFVQKRDTKKFCTSSCRTKYWKKNKGVINPYTQKVISKAYKATPKPPPSSAVGSYHIAPVETGVAKIDLDIKYWESVLFDLERGVMPIFSIVGSLIGLAVPTEKKGIQKAITKGKNTAVGGGAGYLVDLLRKRSIEQEKEQVKKAIYNLKVQKKEAEQLDQLIKAFAQAGQTVNNGDSIEIISDKDYLKANIPTIDLYGFWKYFLGYLEPDSYGLITGLPKNADYFQENHGQTVYFQSEQRGRSKAFQKALPKATGKIIHTNPPRNVENLIRVAKEQKAKLIVLDSINNLGFSANDLKRLKDEGEFITLGVMQSTKEGKFKGNQEFLHDCDFMINLTEFEPMVTHSRYGTMGTKVHMDDVK